MERARWLTGLVRFHSRRMYRRGVLSTEVGIGADTPVCNDNGDVGDNDDVDSGDSASIVNKESFRIVSGLFVSFVSSWCSSKCKNRPGSSVA